MVFILEGCDVKGDGAKGNFILIILIHLSGCKALLHHMLHTNEPDQAKSFQINIQTLTLPKRNICA